ncbi:hypothetical protein HDU93_004287, partial [Gonapodya sp. JEL0774]
MSQFGSRIMTNQWDGLVGVVLTKRAFGRTFLKYPSVIAEAEQRDFSSGPRPPNPMLVPTNFWPENVQPQISVPHFDRISNGWPVPDEVSRRPLFEGASPGQIVNNRASPAYDGNHPPYFEPHGRFGNGSTTENISYSDSLAMFDRRDSAQVFHGNENE